MKKKTIDASLIAILGEEEGRILKVIAHGYTDMDSIHFLTGIPLPCIKVKVDALVSLGMLVMGNGGLKFHDEWCNDELLIHSLL